MKVLFTSPILEQPAAGGPQLRIQTSIQALSRVCELHLATSAEQAVDPKGATRVFFEPLAKGFLLLPGAGYKLPSGRILRRLHGMIRTWYDRKAIRDAEALVAYVDRHAIDVLWCGYGNISHAMMRKVRALRPDLKIVCDTDSVWSRYVLRELPYIKGRRKLQVWMKGRRKIAEERDWVRFCNVTTAVSEVDAEYYRSLAPDPSRIRLFSNVIDLASYPKSAPAPAGFRKPCLYLAGSFGGPHSPMSVAARWMLEDIFPKVRERVPGVHFYVVGRNSDAEFGRFAGPDVTVTGRLDSVLPYLLNADVALVPLQFESGTRFKILEAGACRIPLVSTTLGAEGIPVKDGEHILLADTSEEFADAIVRLLNDPEYARKLAENCRKLVEKHYSVESLSGEALQILGTLNND